MEYAVCLVKGEFQNRSHNLVVFMVLLALSLNDHKTPSLQFTRHEQQLPFCFQETFEGIQHIDPNPPLCMHLFATTSARQSAPRRTPGRSLETSLKMTEVGAHTELSPRASGAEEQHSRTLCRLDIRIQVSSQFQDSRSEVVALKNL